MNGGGFMGAWTAGKDAYRAYLPDAQYHWGSSQVKGHMGHAVDEQITYGLNPAKPPATARPQPVTSTTSTASTRLPWCTLEHVRSWRDELRQRDISLLVLAMAPFTTTR